MLAAFLAPGTPLYATCSSCYCVAAAVAEPIRATDETMGSMSKPVQTRLTHLNDESKPNQPTNHLSPITTKLVSPNEKTNPQRLVLAQTISRLSSEGGYTIALVCVGKRHT